MEEHLQPGQVISGRFRLERLLGQGGMGTVWEARHLSLETQIAIKFLNSDLSRRHDVLARFAREATSAARINSPHVVSILDSGFTDDGRGFIAMELLRGEDLGRRLARVGTLTLGETALLVAQVARGLAKAHAVGVVHRDLKPENIFVVDEDDAFTVKILDFGIAKSIGPEAATHKTDTGQLLGTPLYMSPEQALGRPIDSRSDLYSLSVVAYRCLAGRPPFTYDAVGELIVAVSTHAAPPPSEFNPELSAEIDAWFATALAKDPSARACQKASEFVKSFGRVSVARGALLQTADAKREAYRPSRPPPRRNDTEETPVPSAEEVATTLHAGPVAFAPRAGTGARFARLRIPALIGVCMLAAVLVAFQRRLPSIVPNAHVVPAPPKAEVLARTLEPALAASGEAPPSNEKVEARAAARPPALHPANGSPVAASPAPPAKPADKVERPDPAEALPAVAPAPAPIEPAPAAPEVARREKRGLTLDRGDPWPEPDAGK